VRFIVQLRSSAGFANGCSHMSVTRRYAGSTISPNAKPSSQPPADRVSRVRCVTGRSAGDEHPSLMLRVAYIHSSEEAMQVADARERALAKRGRA